ncbi:hypothetical protein [Halalkalibacter oceani]|uniref:hypothetical protein n=1 Tax=Halalkalibacter oceani TaxID=1653776 RepID=UPI003393B6AB
MKRISEALEKKEIMNAAIIQHVKQYIHKKYPQYSSQQRARVFAKALQQMIEQSLPDYDEEAKMLIRSRLLQRHMSATSFQLNALHIFEASLEVVPLTDSKLVLLQWLKEKTDIQDEHLESFVKELLGEPFTEEAAAASEELPALPFSEKKRPKKLHPKMLASICSVIAGLLLAFYLFSSPFLKEEAADVSHQLKREELAAEQPLGEAAAIGPPNALPATLQFQLIDEKMLHEWLTGRDSLLADEPYFSAILQTAQEFNVHPLLLFAITGQEQGFVPRTHERAETIANNPFNVFHSWEDFNTDVKESSEIAARTVVNLSENRPAGFDPIQWINRKYAEDENWWRGVRALFEQLRDDVGQIEQGGKREAADKAS